MMINSFTFSTWRFQHIAIAREGSFVRTLPTRADPEITIFNPEGHFVAECVLAVIGAVVGVTNRHRFAVFITVRVLMQSPFRFGQDKLDALLYLQRISSFSSSWRSYFLLSPPGPHPPGPHLGSATPRWQGQLRGLIAEEQSSC